MDAPTAILRHRAFRASRTWIWQSSVETNKDSPSPAASSPPPPPPTSHAESPRGAGTGVGGGHRRRGTGGHREPGRKIPGCRQWGMAYCKAMGVRGCLRPETDSGALGLGDTCTHGCAASRGSRNRVYHRDTDKWQGNPPSTRGSLRYSTRRGGRHVTGLPADQKPSSPEPRQDTQKQGLLPHTWALARRPHSHHEPISRILGGQPCQGHPACIPAHSLGGGVFTKESGPPPQALPVSHPPSMDVVGPASAVPLGATQCLWPYPKQEPGTDGAWISGSLGRDSLFIWQQLAGCPCASRKQPPPCTCWE